MIVAHPDDETIWGGMHLASENYRVVCLTYDQFHPRGKEFHEVMEATGSEWQMLGWPDLTDGKEDKWKDNRKVRMGQLESIIREKDWKKIVTHNPEGEYGHPHHILTSRMVTSIVKTLRAEDRLFYFGPYYDAGDQRLNRLPRMQQDDLLAKKRLCLHYASQNISMTAFSHMCPYEFFVPYCRWKHYGKSFLEKCQLVIRQWQIKARFRFAVSRMLRRFV